MLARPGATAGGGAALALKSGRGRPSHKGGPSLPTGAASLPQGNSGLLWEHPPRATLLQQRGRRNLL